MEPLLGRTVSHIKNRFYQNLKGRDLSKIVYEEDEEASPPNHNDEKRNSKKLKLASQSVRQRQDDRSFESS